MPPDIRLFQVFAFLARLDLWDAVYVLFLLGRGFSLAQYGVLDSLWYAGTLLFEVPTGALTDRYGKRISFLLSLFSTSLAFLVIASTRSFFVMSAAFALWGFASSFETGTYSAFLFDSLKELNSESAYERLFGRVTTLQILASALGGVIAGYLAGIDLSLPILGTALISLLLCPLVLLFREPRVASARDLNFRLHIRESVRYIWDRPLVAALLGYGAIMGAALWALRIFYQPLLRSSGAPVQVIGLSYVAFKLLAAAGAHVSHSIHRRLGVIVVYIIPLGLAIAVLALGFVVTPVILSLILVVFFIEGLYQPIVSALLNQNVPSCKRATIISLGSFVSCGISLLVNTPLGWIGDALSLRAAFQVIGMGILSCMGLLFLFVRREAWAQL